MGLSKISWAMVRDSAFTPSGGRIPPSLTANRPKYRIAGQTAAVSMSFDVKDSVVTGTITSEHTGPGTVTDGKWEDGKLSCTLTFEKHESIKFWGGFKDGKLSGEFATEGMTGTWTAARK